MRDDPIEPVRPISGVHAVRDIEIPSHPSLAQLQTWLRFARRMAGRRKASEEHPAPEATSASETHPEDHRGPGKWA